ncbi:MAG TPA: Nramp family divalent metal transporter [Abditibacterium sp.]|jgi:manganese transport protein
MNEAISSNKVVSLPEVHGSITVPGALGRLKTFLAFAGPGYLVSVGYMDPGNWATDLAGGSQFGYSLLWVILASNLMAMLLQTLCARLGIVTGRDLAQSCRDTYKKPAAIALWLLCEIAIIACDLAEVIGSAIAINLLSGGRISLVTGVIITGLDVLLLLGAMRFGFRKLEAIVITLVATVAGCFALQIFFARPDWGQVARGALVPSVPNSEAFVIALGILGATVMPHNLYLHTALVQTRHNDGTPEGKHRAINYNTLDTIIALGAAFFVNAAILVLAAAVFHKGGIGRVEELERAYELLSPTLGVGVASTLFAVALLASGQSSTITGTLAGQIVMEGFLNIRIKPWIRRMITRGLAIIPAIILISASGGKNTVMLLIVSQVVLSMQLSFAIFPLLMFTSDRKRMGEFVNPLWLSVVGYAVCIVIALLNVSLLYQKLGPIWVGILALLMGGFSLWVMFGYKPKPQNSGAL